MGVKAQNVNAQRIIRTEHDEIHVGDAFEAFYNATGKADGAFINIYFKTPNSAKEIHLLPGWSSSGAAYFRILEAPTVTSNTGTNASAIFNHNRNSATTSGVLDNATTPAANKFGKDVTITDNGTVIFEEYAGTAKQMGAMARGDTEFVLKRNTAYVLQVESDAAASVLALNPTWYEHDSSSR